jgi:integrase/recombinase XerD
VSAVEQLTPRRTSAKPKARELATSLRRERPDHAYLKEVFRQLRVELRIVVSLTPKRLRYVTTEGEIRINEDKGGKNRVVPFPSAFKAILPLHHDRLRQRGASYLFEYSWKKPYSDRGVRRLLERYATAAGLPHPISHNECLHFLLTWLKKQGIDDALIQPYSGHASRQSLEIYSRLAIADAQTAYADAMGRFPV